MKFYKNLKEYAKEKGLGYCHFIQTKNTHGLPENLIEIPKGIKYIEKN